MFDINKLNKSSFRNIPFYTREDELSGGNRLTDHSFINGGTKTESNGVKNNVFKINGYIGGDNYLDQKKALKNAFEDITAGTLIDKFYGVQTVYVDSWSIKETIKRLGRAELEITFRKAENNVVEDFDIVYNIDVRADAVINFEQDFNNKIGNDLVNDVASDIAAFWDKVLDIVKFLEDQRDIAQNIKQNIGGTILNIKTTILSIESLVLEIQNIWTSFDEILDTSLLGRDEQKSFTNTLRTIIEEKSAEVYINEAQKEISKQSQTYINLVIAGLTQTAIKNLENIDFSTGDDFGSVKDDVLTILELLEKSIEVDSTKSIEEIAIKQSLLNNYHLSKRTFIQFYTQKYSGLQNLKDKNITATTNALNLTMELYTDISRVDEVLVNNDIVDPIFINGNIKLLDR